MEVKELGHLVLYVRNLDSSASFYRDVLGWRQIMGGPGDEPQPFRAAAFSAPGGRTHHELLLIEVGDDAAGLRPGGGSGSTTSASRSATATTSCATRWPRCTQTRSTWSGPATTR